MVLERWKHASNYMGEDLTDYYIVVSKHRDSDYYNQSNFDVALKRLGGECEPNVIIAHFGHWAVGWIEQILVHKDASETTIMEAEHIVDELEEYPILDEDHYANLKAPVENEMFDEIKRDLENSKENGDTICRYWNDLSVDASDDEIWEIIQEAIV